MPDPSRELEICGEGRTDIGHVAPPGMTRSGPESPTEGIVPVLVHKLCGQPDTMKVVRRAVPFLPGKKKFWQKVKYFKQQAFYNGSAGAVFVMDSEGDHKGRLAELVKGRDSAYPDFPMAVGVAHPCIETWLLADPGAIARALGLPAPPDVPEDPENLPAPRKDRTHNPKTVLAACAGGSPVSAQEATRIATEIVDLALVRRRCPVGFEPFAEEVDERIGPLFH